MKTIITTVGRIRRIGLFKPLFLFLISTLLISYSSYTQVNLNSGLIAYLPFNGDGQDYSGNNNHAVNAGGTTQVYSGVDRLKNFPGSMRFFGDNGQAKMTFNTSLLSNRSEYTISFWVYLTSAPSSGGMNVFGQDNLFEVGFYEGPNRFTFYHPNGTITAPVSSPIYNTWRHFLITGNSTSMSVYMNGTLVQTLSGDFSLGNSSVLTNIGGHVLSQTSTQWLKGRMDNLRIYSRIVTTDEIAALYADNQAGISINSVSASTFCAGN